MVAKKSSTKFINPPPGIAPTYFQDRLIETKQVVNFLHDDNQRLMTVVGRGGVGKTAMVCRLLKTLESGQLPDNLGEMKIDGIVYLSESGSHRVNFPNIFADLSKLLSSVAADKLDTFYKDPKASVESKMNALLENFQAERVMLLLDNFEPVVNPETQKITDKELDEALCALVSGPHHMVNALITTRIAPRELNLCEPGRQRVLTLEEGLESPYAKNILREMDEDGKLGLKDREETDPLLQRAREKTRGYPRALEALFAILSSDRYTTLEELLEMSILPEYIVEALVGEAFSRLDATAQKVMQALAVYNRPVTPAAVDYLLQHHLPEIDSTPVLNRLVNMHFMRLETGRYYLHPVDREYVFSRISEEGAESPLWDDNFKESAEKEEKALNTHLTQQKFVYNQIYLLSRAASYFAKARKPRSEWKILDDLNAPLAEFDLLCAAGDFDRATKLLNEFDSDYLYLWGHYHLMIDLHKKLQERIINPELARHSIGAVGKALGAMGKVMQEISNYKIALTMAKKAEDRQEEGAWLDNLGSAYYSLGNVHKAIEFYEKALVIAREINDRKGEGSELMGLGNCYDSLGDSNKSIGFYEKALVIAREISNRRGEGSTLISLGSAYYSLGKTRKAIELYENALAINREIGARSGESSSLLGLGISYGVLGDSQKAIKFFEKALVIAREISDRRSEGIALSNLGEENSKLNNVGESLGYYDQALQNARNIGNKYGESKRLNGLSNVLIIKGEYGIAIENSQEALRNGQTINSPEVCIECGFTIALALLLSKRTNEALEVIQEAEKYDQPHFNFMISILHGIITLRNGESKFAQKAFITTITQADKILIKTPSFYDALNAKGLALSGLAICEDKRYVSDAIDIFKMSRKIAPQVGIMKRTLRLFDELAKCDSEGLLAGVREAVEGKA